MSEAVGLRLQDIDSGWLQLLIEQAKGKKARYVELCVLLDTLRAAVDSA